MDVIYIDDDAANRAVLGEMFQLGQVGMAQAADARTGLAMLDAADYALILMDLRMPEMNGLTAIRQVRARSDAKGTVPIVVVTADLTAGVRQMCCDAGADGFVIKPVEMGELFAAVGKALTHSRTATLA